MIQWNYYPRSRKPPVLALRVVGVFEERVDEIDSAVHEYSSDGVLAKLAGGLSDLGFAVETGKTADQRIRVPVLFGLNGYPEKSFDADAYHEEEGFVVEIEAGRGVTNNQFLKDLFQACMMHGVQYLAIGVRNTYRKSKDFERASRFFDTLYASNRLQLPLAGVLLIGY